MFVGRKEETTPATQIALVGHIVDGAADIQSGYLAVTFMPLIIE